MLGRGFVFTSENTGFSLLSSIYILYLVSTAYDACICSARAVTLATSKPARIEANASGSLRHDVTSACFYANDWFTFQSTTVTRSMLYTGLLCHVHTGLLCHVHTLPQFKPRLTNAPRSLRSLLVKHCKRCPECAVYHSLFQHSCVHTSLKYDVPL